MQSDNAIYEEVSADRDAGKVKFEFNDSYGCMKKSSNDWKLKSRKSNDKKFAKVIGLTFAFLVLILGGVAAGTGYALVEIFTLRSELASSNKAMLQQNTTFSSMLKSVIMNVSLEVMMYQQLVRDLEVRVQKLQDFSNNTAEIRDLEIRIQQLQDFINTTTEMVIATLNAKTFTKPENASNRTLQQLKNSISVIYSFLNVSISTCDQLPESLSAGYYNLVSSTGSAVRQYCPSITTRCGQTGRWRSVANLDMTNSTHQCFNGLRQHTYSNKRLCVRSSDSSGCSSVQLPTTTPYRSVCGLVKAYQFGSTDAFQVIQYSVSSIDSPYVDGVSITHGSPRQHIWTLASARNERDNSSLVGCFCMGGTNSDRPAFVSNDYFCDTGTSTAYGFSFYGDDPLWDGAGCDRPTNNCCSFNTPPWFYKELPRTTYDGVELRVCCNQVRSDEDIAIEAVTIYVK